MRRLARRTFLGAAVMAALGACTDRKPAVRAGLASTSSLPSAGPTAGGSLDAVLLRRRSERSLLPEPLGAGAIARLLWAAQGQTAPWGGRTAPSAGGLYPLEVYVATADRLGRYVPGEHVVEVVGGDLRPDIAAATGGQETAVAAPVLFVVTGVVARTAAKYGDRAERYVQLEAGHACQNLLLEATALGLGAVPIGSFDDDSVRQAIGASDDEQPLYVVPVGSPVASPS